jgi:hypothetical protein
VRAVLTVMDFRISAASARELSVLSSVTNPEVREGC